MAPKAEKSGSKKRKMDQGSSSQAQPQHRDFTIHRRSPSVWPRDEGTPFAVDFESEKKTLKEVLNSKKVSDRIISNDWDDFDSLLYNSWLNLNLQPTRVILRRVINQLGIEKEVIGLLKTAGLKRIVSHEEEMYPDLVRQFFASVRLSNRVETPEQKTNPDLYFLSFMANGTRYGISARTICKIFGFQDVPVSDFPTDIDGGVHAFWSLIGTGDYNVDKSTHSDVRHPVIRILVRLISLTILCKLEPGKMRKHELVLLSYALRDIVPNATWDTCTPNLGMVFMDHLYSLRLLPVSTAKIGSKQLSVGSLLTPIFRACEVQMTGYVKDPTRSIVDIDYMTRCQWIIAEKYWIFQPFLGQKRMVEFPLPELMPVLSNPALLFFAPDERLIRQVESSKKLLTRGASTSGASTSQATAPQAPPQVREHHHVFPSSPNFAQTEHEKWMTRTQKAIWDALACISKCVRPRTPSPPRQPVQPSSATSPDHHSAEGED